MVFGFPTYCYHIRLTPYSRRSSRCRRSPVFRSGPARSTCDRMDLCARPEVSRPEFHAPHRSPALEIPLLIQITAEVRRQIAPGWQPAQSYLCGDLPGRSCTDQDFVARFAMCFRAVRLSEESSLNHQRRVCVSSSRRNRAHSHLSSSSGGSGSKNSGPTWSFPFKRPGLRSPFAASAPEPVAPPARHRAQMTISSPRQASSISFERLVFALWMVIGLHVS